MRDQERLKINWIQKRFYLHTIHYKSSKVTLMNSLAGQGHEILNAHNTKKTRK